MSTIGSSEVFVFITTGGLPPVVAGTSAGLVPASPPRPAQPVPVVAGRPAGQGGEQVLGLVAGQRDQPRRWWGAGALGGRGPHQNAEASMARVTQRYQI